MSVTHNLTVKHHQQDTGYYCGAACAQMVLDTIGAGILDQDNLYADNHSHSTLDSGVNWATGPDGLTWTMVHRKPVTFANTFVLFDLTSEDLISRKICWTIHHYQVAPIALVYGWAHWITIKGYTASAHPASSGDNTYAIDAFFVNNPWPPTPSGGPPPPHSAGDLCGTGGARGVADEHVTYATWQSTYMTGVPGGYWVGKFIAVCDPEPPAQRGGAVRPTPRRPGRGDLLAPAAAAEFAAAGLKQYGLFEHEEWRTTLAGVQPGTPLLVQRLDELDSFYYLVPLLEEKRPAVIVSVDARWGDYRQAVILPRAENPHTMLSPDEAFKRIVGKRIELADLRGRVQVRKEAVCRCPHLVWRPCMESLSPYYPFYMFSVGDDRLYVRIDGPVFASLTLDQKGI